VTHIGPAALCIVVLLGIVFSRKRALTIGLILLAGLLYSPFFPNLMAILLSHCPVKVHGRAVGILFATASIGWTAFPMLIGAIVTRSTLQRGFLVAVGCSVALLALVTGHFIYAAK
jgi:MFS family permease